MQKRNEYGAELDRAGYAPSILQREDAGCAICGRTWGVKLDRHEPWGAANREKSKELGLWIKLCHDGCHEGPGSVHADGELARAWRRRAQRAAMKEYGWDVKEWRGRFGKSEIGEDEAEEEEEEEERETIRQPKRAETVIVSVTLAPGFRVLADAPELPF